MIDVDDPLFTTVEGSKYLNCSPSFLAKERMKGSGPEFIRMGRAIRYSRSALEAYKAANTRVSTSEYDAPGAPSRSCNRHIPPRRQECSPTSIPRGIRRSTSPSKG
jgi:hypothetical protein